MSSLAKPAPRVIDCTARAPDGGSVALTLTQDELKIAWSTSGAEETYTVQRPGRITGAGESARLVLSLSQDGEISYHEVYGCLHDVRLKLNGKVSDLKSIQCTVRGAPPCPERAPKPDR